MGRSTLDTSKLISNVDLFMYLIEGIRFGTWKNRRLNWALLTFSYSSKDFKYMHHCKLYSLVLFVGQYSISQTLSFGRCVFHNFETGYTRTKFCSVCENCQAVLVSWAWLQVECENVHPFGSLYVNCPPTPPLSQH